ncbi:MAG: D-alanyl-D-alanine carboxypeptidase [Geminicoccaceae bacterium]
MRILVVALCLGIFTSTAFATTDGDALVRRFDLQGSRIGYLLVDAASGKVLESRDPERPMIPASTIKLVTALAALDRLGPDYRLQTRLWVDGDVSDGQLDGDLVLEGGGDVEFDIDDLMELALGLRSSGIRTVKGRLLLDDDAFARFPEVNPDQPPDATYNAGVGPMALAFSRVSMRADGMGNYSGLPPLVERGPAWSIVASARPKRSRAIPVRDVGMHAARNFALMARRLGIAMNDPERGTVPPKARLLRTISSKPLSELVEDMLLYSNNQLAETLGLVLSGSLGRHPRTLAQSAQIAAEIVTARIDADWSALHMENHSGLSPATRATPAQLAALLRYGLDRHDLPELLATSGWSGSLERRLAGDGTALRVWAKTGSLDFASALAGYLLADDGLRLFVIMTANDARRAVYDSMKVPNAAIRREADEWEVRSRALQDALVTGWLRRR